jgi:putative redox protein
MKSEKVTFAGHSGDMLAARLDLPSGPVRAAAILAHCFTCSKDIAAARRISGRLAALGIAVLRFDFTGLGYHKVTIERPDRRRVRQRGGEQCDQLIWGD